MQNKIYTVIGLMSGTSIDGVDAALIKTDGLSKIEYIDFISIAYSDNERKDIICALGHKEKNDIVNKAEEIINKTHANAVNKIKESYKKDIDLIGFHGQTIYHDPSKKTTIQIGCGQKLANDCKIDVIGQFRINDVESGGNGAPLIPVFHQAIIKSRNLPMPTAILNLGGVGNITYINDNEIIAFDTGPANALLDDFIYERTGNRFDDKGEIAASGTYDIEMISKWLEDDYFKIEPPKSLDRDKWKYILNDLKDLNTQDGAANLTAFSVLSTVLAMEFFNEKPYQLFISGGGRLNLTMMESFAETLECRIRDINELELNGDAIEAQGFAYMAVRSIKNLPISFPKTTGVKKPLTGGILYKTKN